MSGLGELIARVEGATGADEWIDADVHLALGTWKPPKAARRDYAAHWSARGINYYQPNVSPLTASLDAVLALAAEKLPGWARNVHYVPGLNPPARAMMLHGRQCVKGKAAVEVLALLAAVLRALDTQEAAEGGRVGEHG